MSKRKFPRAKRPEFKAAPLLLTYVDRAEWSDGVLLVHVENGPEAGCIALGPDAVLALWQEMQGALCADGSPFSRTRADLVRSVAQQEPKP